MTATDHGFDWGQALEAEDAVIEQLDRWGLHGVESPIYPTDLAELMREGVPPAPMLLDDWLYDAELHWIYAEAEAWKTWVALLLALDVMKQGKRVAWFDEELGKVMVVRRLLALGADPDVIEKRFAYFPFPNLDARETDVTRHRDTLKAIAPALVVYDTATDMLTAAGLDENSGREVTRWVKSFPEVARQLGITQIVCDHTAKGGETAVGSRAKRAKAKVQYYFVSEERGDAATVGKLRVTLTKNTPGNELPQERIFRIGGDGSGCFVFDLEEVRATKNRSTRASSQRTAVRDRIAELLRTEGPLNLSQLKQRITDAGSSMVDAEAKKLAAEPLVSGIESRKVGQAILLSWVGRPNLPNG